MTTMASRNRVLPLALGLATTTTFLTYRWLKMVHPGVARGPERQIEVVVPVSDVAPLRLLKASMFARRSVAADRVPRDAVTDPAKLENRVSRAMLQADRPVSWADVVSRSPELGLAFVDLKGHRAVTVKLDAVSGVAGFLKPGNHVDVLASFSTPTGVVTRTVLQDVEVLALGSELPAASGKPANGSEKIQAREQPNATLAVLPAEAERLVLADSKGQLRLALRAIDDIGRPKSPGVSEAQLTGVPSGNLPAGQRPMVIAGRPTAPARARDHAGGPAAAPHRVLVVRGSDQEVVQLSHPPADHGSVVARPHEAAGTVVAADLPAVSSDPRAAAQAQKPSTTTAQPGPTAPVAARTASEGGVR
jgi:pilus assembly protein CpaB